MQRCSETGLLRRPLTEKHSFCQDACTQAASRLGCSALEGLRQVQLGSKAGSKTFCSSMQGWMLQT